MILEIVWAGIVNNDPIQTSIVIGSIVTTEVVKVVHLLYKL